MKIKILLSFICALVFTGALAQTGPVWTQTMNTLPDSSNLFPVSAKSDYYGNVFVVTSEVAQSSTDGKIHIYKYSPNGNLLWSRIFDNGGVNAPRAFDSAIDTAGNIYIAGGLMTTSEPLILKYSSSGMLVWQTNTISAISNNWLTQIICSNGNLYVQASTGLAMFDINGSELWSQSLLVYRIAVDNLGRMVASVFSSYQSIVRYNLDGTINFQDSSITAIKIAIDQNNNITAISGTGFYEIFHYDSSGTFQWRVDSLPYTPPFGDYSLEVLTDLNNDIIAIGLNDTMFKFNESGNLIWKKSMNGLDTYYFTAKIISVDVVLIAGTIQGPSGYDIKVATFDLLGNENWSGVCNSNNVQEFTADAEFNAYSSSIYLLEDSMSSSSLMRFEFPPSPPLAIDYNLICIDSVWYEPSDPNFINIRVFNGNISHLNYPSMQMVNSLGDTISNPGNLVNFFAHLGNGYLTYTDSIFESGIVDFSNYQFFISEGFGDTTVQIGWCLTNSIDDGTYSQFSVFPNPMTDHLRIMDLPAGEILDLEILDCNGRLLQKTKVDSGNDMIEMNNLSSGLYLLRLKGKSMMKYSKVIKS